MSDFVHLHLHSEYSLLDGACRIKEIPKAAAAAGHTAVAITDHGAMYGAVAFFKACREEEIKPIIGCEVYVAPRSRFEKIAGRENAARHMVLLCENETGYKNLIKIVSLGYTEGFYSRPRVDDELLRKYHGGLIALSACLAGEIPSRLVAGDYDGAKAVAEKYSSIFGKDNFYIELQNHGIAEQRQILPSLARISRECGIGMVATNDVHYLKRTDAATQALLMCIQTNSVISDGRPAGFETDEFFYKSTDEMRALFGSYEGALENTVKIAERCNFEFSFGKTLLPAFHPEGGVTADEALRGLALKGLERYMANSTVPYQGHTEAEYRERLDYELSVIRNMGYSDYFLIVADYVGFAKSRDIPVGPGRGSGAGSLTAYLTGITDIDPICFGLYFERFLNPERVSMPDIDIDFCYERRDEVLKYVKERYGSEHVSQIITFGTMAARAVIRDVGRAMGMPYAEVDEVAKLIPRELGVTLGDALENEELREKYESSGKIRDLIDTARALEGMPRNVSVHAAGVVITELPITDYVPLSVSNGAVITQYDMDTVSELGLLKFDFLALRYLTIIDCAVRQIKEREPEFDIEKVDLSDPDTYALISRGQTLGVFQLESTGMRAMLTSLAPRSIDDILAAIALYRPGPMDSIPKYIAGRNEPDSVVYPCELLRPVLSETYGCIVYQEQVMSIFRIMAGYSLGRADVVRRAMAKKKAYALEAEREEFINGASERGMSREDAEKLFDDMASFANYAFNKSHAAAYAVISFRTAYLKAHYPREYLSALLTSVLGNQTKTVQYIAEAGKFGIKVLPPDVNQSYSDFHVSGKNITFGLLAVKNVGRQFVDAIIRERESGGAFTCFDDFLTRMSDSELNRRMIETLIKAGAFDCFGVYRSRLVEALNPALTAIAEKSRHNLDGQLDMFSVASQQNSEKNPDTKLGGICVYPDISEYPLRQLLEYEKESVGMCFSGHVLDGFSKHIKDLSPVSIGDLMSDDSDDEVQSGEYSPDARYTDKQSVTVAGIISGLNRKSTRGNETMAFFRLEDSFGQIEVVVFPKSFEKYRGLIQNGEAVCVRGTLSIREGRDGDEVKILLNHIIPLITDERYKPAAVTPDSVSTLKRITPSRTSAPQQHVQPRVLYIRVPSRDSLIYRKCDNLVGIFDGTLRTVFYFADEAKYEDSRTGADISGCLVAELVLVAGAENIVLR